MIGRLRVQAGIGYITGSGKNQGIAVRLGFCHKIERDIGIGARTILYNDLLLQRLARAAWGVLLGAISFPKWGLLASEEVCAGLQPHRKGLPYRGNSLSPHDR